MNGEFLDALQQIAREKEISPEALLETIERALERFQHQPQKWRQLQQTGMRQDWSWERSAAEYEKIYARVMEQAD